MNGRNGDGALADGLPAADAERLAAIVARSESIELRHARPVFANSFAGVALVLVEAGFIVLRATPAELSRSVITCESGPGRVVLPPAREELVCALGVSQLRLLSTAARDELLAMPPVAGRLVEQLAFTLGQKQEALAIFAQTRHVERVRRKLVQLARGYGHVARDGVRIDFPVTHALLAEMIGSSRETVTRALEELQRRGIVARRGSSYYLVAPVDGV